MSEQKKLVICLTQGFDNERANVAWSIAAGGVASGMEVSMFLVSSGVDWVRKNALKVARMNPLDPSIGDFVKTVMQGGGKIMVCPPCAKVRGYEPEDLMDGVEIAGSVAMHSLILDGAATLSF